MARSDEQDPLSIAWAPPAEETVAERAEREQKEAEAKRISDKIDEDIRRERAALRKQKGILRILLLGQAGSGKSTTLKNLRLKYAYKQWMEERNSWRAVIQLNLVRSIIVILDALQAEMNGEPVDDTRSPANSSSEPQAEAKSAPPTSLLSEAHRLLAIRLAPIRRMDGILRTQLGIATDEVRRIAQANMHATPFDPPMAPSLSTRQHRKHDLTARCWSDSLSTLLDESGDRSSAGTGRGSEDGSKITEELSNYQQDLISLWRDESVRKVMQKRHVMIEESAKFFLDDIDRIATHSYEPTDDDAIRARLKTRGVQEYRISFEQDVNPSPDPGFPNEWHIYDVGGSRTMRHAWLPYFDNVNAVIFLAPVSSFDERLDEDPSINRLEDSFILWKAVVSTRLLENATIVLYLNKYDLLEKKIKSGIVVKEYIPSYGDRSNDAQSVVKYLRDHYRDMLKQFSRKQRPAYIYTTSVIDVKAMSVILADSIRDGVIRQHLKNTKSL